MEKLKVYEKFFKNRKKEKNELSLGRSSLIVEIGHGSVKIMINLGEQSYYLMSPVQNCNSVTAPICES